MSASEESVSPDDPRFIARALAHELSEAELLRFQLWLDAHPERRWELKQLERIWMSAGRPRHAWDAEAALQSIRSRAAAEMLAAEPPGAPRLPVPLLAWQREQRRARTWRIAWIGAAAALTLAVGWGTWRRSRPVVPAAAPIAFREVRTDRGETAQLRFPDGTEVQLAPESRLRYPVDMLGLSRDLTLEGEAYVVAGPRGRAPLVIHTAYGTTRDIGTRFLVRAHPSARLDVVVMEGLVVLRPVAKSGGSRAPADSLVLSANTIGTVTAAGELRERRGVRVDDYLSWLDGRLAFTDAPLAEVLRTLARWRVIDYRVIDPAVGARRFTGSLERHESLAQFIDLLALTTNLRISRNGDTILIRDDPARPILGPRARP